MVSMALGFCFMGAFVDGLFRVLGIVPPFMGLDVSIIPELLSSGQLNCYNSVGVLH